MAIPVLPPSAPFTPQQRAYLNGLFAGLVGLDNGIAPTQNGHPQVAVATDDASVNIAAPAEENAPWHDPSLPLDERMKLAQERPIAQKIMAAMAQLDCGQCGYLCHSYAEAIADGSEKSLRKCVPGGKETSNQLKELVASS